MNDIPKNGAGSIPQKSQKIEQTKNSELISEASQTVQENTTPQNTPKDLQNDLKFLQENPKAAAAALDYFDQAYAILKKSGHENPYEESCAQMGACAKEFSK